MRPHRPNELIERHVLIRVGAERNLAGSTNQLRQRRLARNVHAQRQRIHEAANQVLQFAAVPVGDRRSDHDVVLPGVSRQQRRECGNQPHEERRAFSPAEHPELLCQFLGQVQTLVHAVLARRIGPIGDQLELRKTGAALGPVRELAFVGLRFDKRPLPEREVGVLNRQLGERRWLACAERPIERRQLLFQQPPRPTVGGNVVHRDQQKVIVGVKFPELRSEERSRFDVPGLLVLGRDLAHHLGDAGFVLQVTRVGDVDGPLDERLDSLNGRAIDRMEGRANAFVPAHDFVHAPRKRIDIERTAKADGPADVERGTERSELAQEPDALLRERQRKRRQLAATADDFLLRASFILLGRSLPVASADATSESLPLLVCQRLQALFRVGEHSNLQGLRSLTCGHVLTSADAV